MFVSNFLKITLFFLNFNWKEYKLINMNINNYSKISNGKKYVYVYKLYI